MASKKSIVRKLIFAYLFLCAAGVLAYVVVELYDRFGPSKLVVEGIPFGLPAGTELAVGESPEIEKSLSDYSFATRDEIRRATDLLENGEVQQALEVFDAIALTYPALEAARFGSMTALFELDSLDASRRVRLETLTEDWINRYPAGAMKAYVDSRKAYREGGFTTALEFARVASDKAQAFFAYRIWYAELLLQAGQETRAAEEARAAISLSQGGSLKAYALLAKVFHSVGQLDSCSSLLEYASSRFPAAPELLLLRGLLEEYRGNYDQAEILYQKILALRPQFRDASEALATLGEKTPPGNGLGVSITPSDRAKVAREILEPLVNQYPDNLPLREALGRAYLKGKDFDLARMQFLEIQQKDSEYPDIQLRLQEASAVREMATPMVGLAENLNRVADSLRISNPATKHDFNTRLGHYLVRYGASPKEFFSHYAESNFKQIKKRVWQETFEDGHHTHIYTVLFDSRDRYYGVHVRVVDSSTAGKEHGRAPEVFTRLLQQNSRISGIGSATGETECGDVVIDAAVWDAQDNFEILARVVGKPEEVRMVRFDKRYLPMGLKLCDYLDYLNAY
ncbi:MAG: hypothetical protein J6A06_01910 [Fibrobacteraceae bacterium]|jgi:tetratricopeptide (TPR) repeat protein|nr:hypothetical protein [Fibrobacteraceae bacterium]MEE1066951.1 hypothetical protein [Fibrobacteraceae bacterium]